MAASVTGAADALLHQLLLTPEGLTDPYPLYGELRQLAPFYRSELDGAWYASRYSDCRQLLLDPRCGRKPACLVRGFATDDQAFERFALGVRSSMLTEDPPSHTRLRRSITAWFSAEKVLFLQPRIEAVVDRCLQSMTGRGACDAIAELAVPVPLEVAADLVGIPPEDRRYCLELLGCAMEADRPDPSAEQVRAARDAGEAQLAYFRDLVAWRRVAPGDDILSALVASDALDVEELVDMAILLFVGTLSPTANLLGNGLYALLRHPVELTRLRADPGVVPPAVEEMLRYDAPVQGNGRTVHEPMELGGQRLAPGDVVVALIGGANRDPARFSQPEGFDVARGDNHPLSFGAGIHHCLGAGLARRLAHVVFVRLAEGSLTLELIEDHPPRRPSFDQRGFASLPVEVTKR